MNKFSNTITFLFVLVFSLIFSYVVLAEDEIKKMPITLKTEPEITYAIDMMLIDGMGYLPVRRVMDIFQGEVRWNPNERSVIAIVNNNRIQFMIGSYEVIIDGEERKMNKTPKFIDDLIWIPLEFLLTDAFEGCVQKEVSWNFSQLLLDASGAVDEISAVAGVPIGEVEIDKKEIEEKNTQQIEKVEIKKPAKKKHVVKVRYFSHPAWTRFVIELKKKTGFEAQNLEDTNSIQLIIDDPQLVMNGVPLDINDGVIKQVKRIENDAVTELSIELDTGASDHKAFFLPSPPSPRIVLDVNKKTTKKAANGSQKRPTRRTVVIDKSRKTKIKTIVIDPGHGGKDPGAVGRRGLKEKDVVLDVSKRVEKLLKKKLKVKVILTRSKDVFIPLEKRTKIANKHRADLFVSVHANSSLKRKTKGFEIYWLSQEASDAEAQAVANMENSVINLEPRVKNEPELYSILWDMTLNEYMNESSELCGFVSHEIQKRGILSNRGVKQAGFFVLRGAMMPSVLVEVGFVSNSREEKKLRKTKFRQDMAEIIYQGIKRYKTWIESQN